MKEELISVLNNKLSDINADIDSLVELNNKITIEEDNLDYVSSILKLFDASDKESIMNFDKLNKDDFNKVLDILGADVKDVFSSSNCNYDGLVYLIKGINDGVSLTLTDEQRNGIEYLIQKLREKQDEHNSTIDGFKLIKEQYEISDVEELKTKKEKYLSVLDELDNDKYVSDIDLLQEAINFSEASPDKTIDILKFLLEYNASIYEKNKDVINVVDEKPYVEEKEEIKEEVSSPIETFDDTPASFGEFIESNKEVEPEENNDYQEFHFNDVVKDDFTNFDSISFYNYNDEEKKDNDYEEKVNYAPLVEEEEKKEDLPLDNIEVENKEDNSSLDSIEVNENSDSVEFDTNVNEDNNEISDEKLSTNDIHTLLSKYDINEDNTYINELVVGDVKNYGEVLDTLKEHNLIQSFKTNSELLVETLLYSNREVVNNVLEIIKNDLSVDDEDYDITTKIVIETIPSIFVSQGGNYNNFVKNIAVFKELELNLINLFDFSKELFVANNDTIINNLEIVKMYDVNITYQNAKYLLLLSNIGDRLDYYVESVYVDKDKKETFDGIEYINEYTAKLNVVTDETIKRLRYCSENGKKVFGNKPKSLTGDITNLKVNSLDITGEYMSKFFNNEFATLTGDEVREYTKLIHSSSNVGNYDDELDMLDKYRKGLRYVIEGINISYNKVLRNYSILRSYGIDNKKALHFAVCYNLVITKDEYDKLKTVLDNELGGN